MDVQENANLTKSPATSHESGCRYWDPWTAAYKESSALLSMHKSQALKDDEMVRIRDKLYLPLVPQQIRILKLLSGLPTEPLKCMLLRATITTVDGCRLDEIDHERNLVQFDALSYSWVSGMFFLDSYTKASLAVPKQIVADSISLQRVALSLIVRLSATA